VLAGVFAGLSRAVAFPLLPADRITDVTVPLSDPAALLVTEGEARDVDLGDG
jgi:hypothetical protein